MAGVFIAQPKLPNASDPLSHNQQQQEFITQPSTAALAHRCITTDASARVNFPLISTPPCEPEPRDGVQQSMRCKRGPPRYITSRQVYVDDKTIGWGYLTLQIVAGLFIMIRILLFHQFAVLETPVVSANFYTGMYSVKYMIA